MKRYLFCVLALITFLFVECISVRAQSGFVGESISLPGPTAPGTIGAAAWTSSDNNLVYVSGDKYGATATINSYFSGQVTITCTYVYSYYSGGKLEYSHSQHDYYYITCKASTLTLDKNKLTLKLGQEGTLTYSNSSGIELPYVYWSTSDKNIVSFEGGDHAVAQKTVTLYANDVGECVITCNGFTGREAPTCVVEVIANPPTGIRVTPENMKIQEGKTGKLRYILIPDDAYSKVTWSSSNESVAKVSSIGVVTGVSEGQARITATTDNGVSASATVEIAPLPSQISLSDNHIIYLGYGIKLSPILTPSNAMSSYTWETADAEIATIDSKGRVVGKSLGSTTITVKTENNKTASARITVKQPSEGMDARNAQARFKAIKKLINISLENK